MALMVYRYLGLVEDEGKKSNLPYVFDIYKELYYGKEQCP